MDSGETVRQQRGIRWLRRTDRGVCMAGARREFPRRIESLDEIFAFLEAFADEHEFDARTVFCINLVVEELFTNMVRHNLGGADTVTLGLDHDDEQVFLELIDIDVEPFDETGVAAVAVEAGIEARRPGGLGVHLVRSMVDDLEYEYEIEDRRMRIKVRKVLEK
jgi:anti-sigma regulatory factor (Ser/Thr protein kinase)